MASAARAASSIEDLPVANLEQISHQPGKAGDGRAEAAAHRSSVPAPRLKSSSTNAAAAFAAAPDQSYRACSGLPRSRGRALRGVNSADVIEAHDVRADRAPGACSRWIPEIDLARVRRKAQIRKNQFGVPSARCGSGARYGPLARSKQQLAFLIVRPIPEPAAPARPAS